MNLALLDLVEAIIGPNVELWKWGQCVYKQPQTGVPKSLHQDEYYFQHRYHSTVGVLTYAIDTDLTNGALQIVPGSHNLGVLEHYDDQHAGFALDASWWQQALPIPGKAGDSILFHGLTIHGSEENRSDRPRPVFIQRYRRTNDFCTINVGTMAERREAERNPRTTKSDDDWGLIVRGVRLYGPMAAKGSE
jgi:phytanoyl-CoA hydroxylase